MNNRLQNLTTGFFTVVYPNGEHRTIQIKQLDYNKTIIGYMNGRENTRSYRWFAFLNNGYVNFFKNFKSAEGDLKCERILNCLGKIDRAVDETGKAYALKSGNCWVCNRLLTTPESIVNGIGPVCASKREKHAKYREHVRL